MKRLSNKHIIFHVWGLFALVAIWGLFYPGTVTANAPIDNDTLSVLDNFDLISGIRTKPELKTSDTFQAQGSSIMSDDFNTCTLSAFWTHTPGLPGDPGPVLSGKHVSLSVPGGPDHNIWEDGIFANRIMQPADDADFEIQVKFDSQVTQKYQTQGVLVQGSNGDALRFEFHHDGVSNKLYAASIISGTGMTKHSTSIPGGVTPPYMRVKRAGDGWTHAYSLNGTDWISKTFAQVFTVTQVGVYAGNVGVPVGTAPAHTAIIDYFYNTTAPGPGVAGKNTLTVNIDGNGTVAKNPDLTAYACVEDNYIFLPLIFKLHGL